MVLLKGRILMILHRCYFMGYAGTTGVILHWKPDNTFVIHISHHVWFDEYNSHISLEYNHTPYYLLLQKYPESIIHHSDLLNFIPCELDITYTQFYNIILAYEIEVPTAVNKIIFNLLDDEDFKIPYVTDTIPNVPAGHKLTKHSNKNVLIIAINVEETITAQGTLGVINRHQTTQVKSKVGISIFRRKSY